jgi:hypothetical protein
MRRQSQWVKCRRRLPGRLPPRYTPPVRNEGAASPRKGTCSPRFKTSGSVPEPSFLLSDADDGQFLKGRSLVTTPLPLRPNLEQYQKAGQGSAERRQGR